MYVRQHTGWLAPVAALVMAVAVAQPAQAARILARVVITGLWDSRYILDFDPATRTYRYDRFDIDSYYRNEFDIKDAYYENSESLIITMNDSLSIFKFHYSFYSSYENIFYGGGEETFYDITIDTSRRIYKESYEYYGVDEWERDIRNDTQISYRLLNTGTPIPVPLPVSGALLLGSLAVLGVATRRRARDLAQPVTGR